jgi:cell division septation protein DedD
MRTKSIWFGLALVVLPAALAAQDAAPRPPLQEAEWHVARGEFPEARAIVQRWRRANPSSRAEQDEQAHYYLLRGRLTTDADSAEDHYLTVAVNHPTSRYAAEALLRLGQARNARGDAAEAVTYLRRVITDYPSSDHRTMAAIWLVRIEAERGGERALMCDLLRSLDKGTNPEVIANLKLETDRVCVGRTVAQSRAATPTQPTTAAPKAQTPARTPPPRATRADTSRATPAPDTVARTIKRDTVPEPDPTPADIPVTPVAGGRVSVQVGAFRELDRARDMQAQLETAGFSEVRLVRVPGNNLIRVRIGRFVNRAAAESVLARLAAADMSAVLVTDADKETVVNR